MKITQSLTIAVTALLACGFVYSDEIQSFVKPTNSRQDQNPSHAEQFAQADAAAKPAAAENAKSGAPGAEERKSDEIFASVMEKLRGYTSVRAKISEKLAMQSNLSKQTFRFGATGEYLQGQNLKLKMSIEVKLTADLTGKLKEVCDGELLWSSYELGGKDKAEITRRDVRQILKALNDVQQSARIPAGDKALQQAGMIGTLGLGGLPALLAGIEKDFEFQKVTSEKIDDREVVTLEGTWNSKFIEAMNGNKKVKKGKAAEPLPPNVPDVIRISFDKETEFPRRIEYLKRTVGQAALSSLMVLDLTDPKFNERLSRDEFVFFVPNDAKPRDDTQLYLQRIASVKGAQQGAGAEKKAPAKAE
jgi:hypothetical protein